MAIEDLTEVRLRQLKQKIDFLSDDLGLLIDKNLHNDELDYRVQFSSKTAASAADAHSRRVPQEYFSFRFKDMSCFVRFNGVRYYVDVMGYTPSSCFAYMSDAVLDVSNMYRFGFYDYETACNVFKSVVSDFCMPFLETAVPVQLEAF